MSLTTTRLFAVADLLQSRRQWSGPELARRLAVTERTLRRDIERLRDLGYRIETSRGAAGGYRLVAGAHVPPLVLTDDEAVTMAVGLRLAAAEGLGDGDDTSLSALAKLEQVLPAKLRRRIQALAEHVVPQSAPGPSVAPDRLARIALACRDHERIRFRYDAWSGSSTRRLVEPYGLVAAQRRWFLVCWDLDRTAWRTFRLDRLSGLRPTGVSFVPRRLPADDVGQYVKESASNLARRHQADVIVRLPLAQARNWLGRWGKGVTPVDEEYTRWPVAAESPQQLLAALVWIPEGVEFRVEGSPEFLSTAHEWGTRLVEGVARGRSGNR